MKKFSRYGYRFAGVSLDPKSECVPDQSLSVQEILRRFTTGTLLQELLGTDSTTKLINSRWRYFWHIGL